MISRALLLLAALGALAAFLDGAGAGASLLIVAVGVLASLRFRDAERIGALEARLAALEAGAEREASGQATPVGSRPPVVVVPEAGATSTPARASPVGRVRPARPPLLDRVPPELRRVWDFVTGGNAVARAAVVVLFVGMGLGIRYAVDIGVLSVAVRLAAAAVVGLSMVGLGWRLRRGTPGFGLTVQGGGVAVLYLTVYAAYALYGLLPSLVAIVLMGAIAAGCGALALVQNAPGLAVLGVTGGFAAPVLAGTAEGNHVLLLAYYALLNLGVLGAAWAKGWRSVAVVGFVSTFVTGGLWGGLQYRPELYASVQPFVVVNFAIYLALAVRFALRSAAANPPERSLAVDGGLVFGLPAATFALQSGLVEGLPYGRAWSAAALAAVYLGGVVWIRRQSGVRLLADAFLAVGLTFATLALPLAFQRVVFGAMWVLEGAGLVWVGARQGKAWMRWGGIALQAVAAAVLFGEGVLSRGTFDAESLTGWIVAVGLAVSAYVLRAPAAPDAVPAPSGDGAPPRPPLFSSAASVSREGLAGRLLLAFALFWWGTTAAVHVLDLASDRWTLAAMLGAAAASGLLFLGVGRALDWRALRAAAFGVVPAGWALWVLAWATGTEPVVAGRGLGWLALLAVAGLAVMAERAHRLRPAAFVGGAWLAVAVVARSLGDGAARVTEGLEATGWSLGVIGAVLAAGLALAVRLPATAASDRERWRTAAGLAVAVGVWTVASWASPGNPAPLPFLPLLNVLALPTVAGLLALAASRAVAPGRLRAGINAALVALGFGSLTAEVLRAVSAAGGVPWDAGALWASSAAQAALAVTWSVLALVLATVAVRRRSRALWFVGAGVLAVVVAKLFLVDLSQAQALVRIGAFITVGALMLLIGYRAPLPPAPASAEPLETDA